MRVKLFFTILALSLPLFALPAQEVVRIPAGDAVAQANLSGRWIWAKQEAERRKLQQDYWVGYSIVRMMEEGSFFSTHFSDLRESEKTLEEILYGTNRQSHKRTREYYEPAQRYQKFQKDIVVLFQFQPHIAVSGKPAKVCAGNIGLSFDALDYPIVWLGGVSHDESIALLSEQYEENNLVEVKRTLLGIMSWHEQSAKAYTLLHKVLKSKDAMELRKKAALFLGEFDDAETLELLQETAESDRSAEVAENAVLGISRMESDAAMDVLIGLAKKAEWDGVRKKAVHSLSRYASEKVVSTLQDIVYNDKDLELQKQALYALTRLKRDDPVPQLISLAKSHPNNEVRKYAIYLLGQSKDQRALDALIELVKK